MSPSCVGNADNEKLHFLPVFNIHAIDCQKQVYLNSENTLTDCLLLQDAIAVCNKSPMPSLLIEPKNLNKIHCSKSDLDHQKLETTDTE